MSVLIAINKILDIKAVQWALLAATLALLAVSGVQSFRLFISQKEAQYQKARAAEGEALLQAQNAQVLEMKRQGEEFKAKVADAVKASKTIGEVYDKKIADIKKTQIRDDCCGAIEDAKNIVINGLKQ